MEVNNIVMAKAMSLMGAAKIFLICNEKSQKLLLLLIIVNKALEEVCGRRINMMIFFIQNNY